jgi:hypothetical protein
VQGLDSGLIICQRITGPDVLSDALSDLSRGIKIRQLIDPGEWYLGICNTQGRDKIESLLQFQETISSVNASRSCRIL